MLKKANRIGNLGTKQRYWRIDHSTRWRKHSVKSSDLNNTFQFFPNDLNTTTSKFRNYLFLTTKLQPPYNISVLGCKNTVKISFLSTDSILHGNLSENVFEIELNWRLEPNNESYWSCPKMIIVQYAEYKGPKYSAYLNCTDHDIVLPFRFSTSLEQSMKHFS